ncbi:zinc ABC transporter substrate-binding protein ZnuA [Candidatus Steffania adelgidicola]|uniref:zinc ABC transporter substrate-binding protein ZnuA n=1 Tax=Candidatus Steffania adelgidicola TaxID=1076626 RepID=UPI001D011A31|nr:zinc ABC transporter substrate-binding protein ZnuA [Candidatus Steffania adelgidicola]UDG79722.1 High-affinity zinc uptake system protein ZnuA [Candidatus Steffania adelgidicola]
MPAVIASFFLRVFCSAFHCVCFIIVLGIISSVDGHATLVASIRPLGFIAAAIVANGVMPVEVVLPDGASPHHYTLRPTDALQLKKLDLLIWVGPQLETFLSGSVSSLPSKRYITLSNLPSIMPFLQKTSEVFHKDDRQDADGSGEKDQHYSRSNMHVWLSPAIVRLAGEAIHDRLAELMPEKKKQLDDNLRIFNRLLTKNDKNITKILEPVLAKEYYVFHDAFGYFEEYYGLTPSGYFTINPEIQPGAQALYKIRTQLLKKKEICIFAEPQFRPSIINAVIRGTAVHIGTLDPLGMGIALDKDSYARFLLQLSHQYVSCLEKKS